MAIIEAKTVQELLKHIEEQITGIQTAGESGRIKLKDINVEEVRNAIPQSEWELDTTA